MFREIVDDMRRLVEFMAPSLCFKCTECRDTGWASYDDKAGWRTYHVFDHCRKCRPRIRREGDCCPSPHCIDPPSASPKSTSQ
jgi:hypothetical protein